MFPGMGTALSALGGLGGMLGGGGGSVPDIAGGMHSAMADAQKTMAGIKQGFDPFVQTGTAQLSPLSQQYGGLMQDPTQKLSQWMQGYKESPYAQFQQGEITKQLGRQSAAGGMFGTPGAQKTLADYTQGIVGKDMQGYLNRAQGLYGTGLSGAQNLAQMGLQGQTSYSNLAEDLAKTNIQAEQSAMASRLKNQQQKSSDIMGNIGSLAGAAAMFI